MGSVAKSAPATPTVLTLALCAFPGVALKVPEGIEAARAAGCTVTGAYVGSGLSSLQVLGGGLDHMYRGNARGEVDLVLGRPRTMG